MKRRLSAVPFIAFFITGFSALLYESVWQRLLSLFTGSDIRAVTIIVAAYLAGLGFGNLAGSFIADRLSNRNNLRLFGVCNLGIALFAFLSKYIFYDLFFQKLSLKIHSPVLMMALVFASILWPTVLMGLSLPLLSKALVQNIGDSARRIATLYLINTFGACVGVFISGFLLFGTFGYVPSVFIGGTLNLLVGLTVLFMANRADDRGAVAAPEAKEGMNLSGVPGGIRLWCMLVFISGFIFFSLEIIWFRILSSVYVEDSYVFFLLLMLVLGGDAMGILVGSRVLHRVRNPRAFFMWSQGLIALYAVGISIFTAKFCSVYQYQITLIGISKMTSFSRLFISVVLVVPTSFLFGLYYPSVQKAVQTSMASVGRRVGLVEVSNITGNITGCILTGTIILGAWGTPNALKLINALGLAFVIILLAENYRVHKPLQKVTGALLALGLMILLIFAPGENRFWKSMYHIDSAHNFIVAEDSMGVAAINSVEKESNLIVNGLQEGSIPYYFEHVFYGVIPSFLHPNPKDVFVIGIGSSATPYCIGANSSIRRVVAVEIIGAEMDVLREHVNQKNSTGRFLVPFLNDKRIEIRLTDGRRELAISPQKFDIIEADARFPFTLRSGMLYSREFFITARDKLAENGIMVQFAPTNRIVRTFTGVFPYVVEILGVVIGSN